VILDEPFRGLAREQRVELLRRVRAAWPAATLLCVTHDVNETRQFPRVLVLEGGRVAEDGPPERLLADPASRYAALLRAEEEAGAGLWGSAAWRRLRLEGGRLLPPGPGGSP
jgi:ATP-binding cassette subfamily B protein